MTISAGLCLPYLAFTASELKETMSNPGPGATLSLYNSTVRINGVGPISTVFNAEMVRRVFALPPHPDLIWYGEDTLTAFHILSRLTKPALASFTNAACSNAKLREEYMEKKKNFAVYAHPSTGAWPHPDNLMVLESIGVDLPFLLYISWMLDGTIMLGYMADQTISLTPAEFLAARGKTYREYCEEMLPLHIEKCQRTLALLAVDHPKTSTVSFINKDSAVEKKTMVYWQDDQVEQYLHRNELSHIATDPE